MSALIDLSPNAVHELLDKESVLLVDVREISEYSGKHIQGSLMLPMSVFDPEDFPKPMAGVHVVLICALGKRSVAAAKMLIDAGYGAPLINLEGGIKAWAEAGLPLVMAPEDYSI